MKIVFATFGSLGDLHPFVAIAIELKARGHEPVISTHEIYRELIEAEGIGFHPVRPNAPDLGDETEVMRRAMDLRGGPEFIVRLFLPYLRESYEDVTTAASGSEVLVTHMLAFTGALVAEKLRIPRCGVALAPISFLSAYDPPVLPPAPWLRLLRPLGPAAYRPLFRKLQTTTEAWMEPVQQLRRELGLPRSAGNPLFGGQYSDTLNLALFSRLIGAPQPDWPQHTAQTGFPFYDRAGKAGGLPPEVEHFLCDDDPPLVFTLGSSAVMDAGRFYEESAEAARLLGRRALMLIGRDDRNLPKQLPEGVLAARYAPHSLVFPRAAAVVHQGGIGTTAQALRAGRPQLIVPFAVDQPDNAARVARLGAGRVLPRGRYAAKSAVRELSRLLDDPRYALKAAEAGEIVRTENGAKAAADALEAICRR